MSGDREAISEQSSSIREGYDEIYPLGHEPKEDVTWSPERDPSTYSFVKKEEECEESEKGEEEGAKKEDDEEDA